MNNDYVHVSILLDRSGSMQDIKKDTIGGFNDFITTQQGVPGKMTLTMAQFDTIYEVLYNATEIKNVKLLTDTSFQPRGGTALYDSAKKLIDDTGKALAAMKEEDRPIKVMICIITDGEENSSHDTTLEQLKTLVQHQKDVYKWDFVYLGADQDAFKGGAQMNMSGLNYKKDKIATGVFAYTANVTSNRRSSTSGQGVETLTQDDLNAAGAND